MKKRQEIEAHTEELVTPILDRMGFFLYDVEYVKEGADFYLRVYIEKEGGITVDDCEAVSREMNELLDKEDYVDGSYIFEVSSPGLGRTLKKDKHLQSSLGEEVEIKTYQPVEKQKEFAGILQSFDSESLTITEEDGKERTFQRKDIALIRLAFHF